MHELKTDLESLLVLINIQIDEVELTAAQNGIEASQLRTPNGQWPMADLLVAKANVVIALSKLQPPMIVTLPADVKLERVREIKEELSKGTVYLSTDEHIQRRM